ncbi:hypothetical protein L226DRAFT_474018, partial [Lentinus tigrinus ALCF2SS1-7]
IFVHCTAMTLLRFQRTCRLARQIVKDYMRVAFDINHRLRPFFADPQAFRSLQARTGTLISGSTALQFFDRTCYRDTGLDLFVHEAHRREVGRWLLDVGYHFVPASYQASDFEVTILDSISLSPTSLRMLDGIKTIMKFVKLLDGDIKRTVTVQLIVAQSTPMEVILSTHSTCAMNVITYNKAYCLFARATLEAHRSLLSSSTHGIYRDRGQTLSKYTQRGFDFAFSIAHGDATPMFPLGWRWLDDMHTWVLPLDTTGIDSPRAPNALSMPLTHDPSVVCNWNMQQGSSRGVVMQFTIIKSDLLQYQYLVADKDLSTCIGNHLAKQHLVEQEKRGRNSETWALYDSHLPELCRSVVRHFAARRMSCLNL